MSAAESTAEKGGVRDERVIAVRRIFTHVSCGRVYNCRLMAKGKKEQDKRLCVMTCMIAGWLIEGKNLSFVVSSRMQRSNVRQKKPRKRKWQISGWLGSAGSVMSKVRCLSCQKWRVMNAQKPACSDVCEDKASWPDG